MLILICCLATHAQVKNKAANRNPKKKVLQNKNVDYSKIYEDKWIRYSQTDSSDYFYNPAKAKKTGLITSVWTESRDSSDNQVLAKMLYEINCNSQQIRNISGVSYFDFDIYPDGRKEKRKAIMPDSWDTPNAVFKTIIPDTIGDSLAKQVCSL